MPFDHWPCQTLNVSANVAALTAENQKLRTENRELTEQANGLAARTHELAKNLAAAAEEIAKYRARFFGRSSEKLSLEEQQQMGLFDEDEQAGDESQEQEARAEQPPPRCRPAAAASPSGVPCRSRCRAKR